MLMKIPQINVAQPQRFAILIDITSGDMGPGNGSTKVWTSSTRAHGHVPTPRWRRNACSVPPAVATTRSCDQPCFMVGAPAGASSPAAASSSPASSIRDGARDIDRRASSPPCDRCAQPYHDPIVLHNNKRVLPEEETFPSNFVRKKEYKI